MNLTIRCSGLARPMVCAGSLFFTDLPPPEDNEAAKEGTAAGELLAKMLTGEAIGTHASNGVPFNDDMYFYTRPVAQEIVDKASSKIICEQSIDWQTNSGIWIKGQYDISYTSIENQKTVLNIDDLKYGYGLVEVFENWQLLGYAIGEVIRRGIAYDEIVLRIRQPRPHHEDGPTRKWVLTYNELLAYKEKIENRMTEIANGNKTLITSDKCKYCPAAVRCPAINKAFWRGIEVAHEFMQDSIDEKEISHQLDLIARVSEVLKIKQDSIKALALDRIKNGKMIPNYSTEASYGDRKWKAGLSPQTIKALTGVNIIEEVMLSPAKAEKAGVPKDFVTAMVDRYFLGNKLIRKDSSKTADRVFGKGAK